MLRLLILGGTSEASALANALAGRTDIDPVLSLAGRTEHPAVPPIAYRIGGFGGVDGLTEFIGRSRIDAVVDATHPFATRISANAVTACARGRVPLATFTRRPWHAEAGDRWTVAPDIEGAAATLGAKPLRACLKMLTSPHPEPAAERPSRRTQRVACFDTACRPAQHEGVRVFKQPLRVFLTTGRLDIARFKRAPQHHYLIRTIDPPMPSDLPPRHTLLLARGPFTVDGEEALLRTHDIGVLVTKNSGAAASSAKLRAARHLGLPVIMVDRPPAGGGVTCYTLEDTLAWIAAQRERP